MCIWNDVCGFKIILFGFFQLIFFVKIYVHTVCKNNNNWFQNVQNLILNIRDPKPVLPKTFQSVFGQIQPTDSTKCITDSTFITIISILCWLNSFYWLV